jgi:mannose-6-phosphate isomerase-like protein (cupin superfamily)
MIISNAKQADAVTTASGTELRVLLDTRQGGQGRMSLAMETLKPGQHTEPHWHVHLEEIYYILAGQGRMEIGQEAESVRAGDTILIPLNRVHCLYNTGDGDLALLCAVSPPWHPQDHHSAEENQP